MSSKLKNYSYQEDEDGDLPPLVTGQETNIKEILNQVKADGGKNIVSEAKITSANNQLDKLDFSSKSNAQSIVEANENKHHIAKKIPITIVTGYLGSGKSTLLSKITKRGVTDMKIAVILNEFGDSSDIERSMTIYNQQEEEEKENRELQNSQETKQPVKESSVTEWLDLGNGCLCCSVRDVGVKAIENLVERLGDEIDYILLETSGLADPGPIADMFWLEEGLMSTLQLDGIVCVLDAEHILDTLKPCSSIAKRQISMSDCILLNKMDKCTNEKEIIAKLKSINEFSPIIKTSFGELETVNQILNLNAYSAADQFVGRSFSHNEEKSDHIHTSGISTFSFEFPALTTVAQYDKLISILRKLHWKNFGLDGYDFGNIHRTKGLILDRSVSDNSLQFKVLQGVRSTFDIFPGAPLPNVDSCKIVFIGENLQKEGIKELLDSVAQC